MAVGLGKIAKHAPARRIELFRQQPHVVAAGEQPLKQPLSVFIAALQNVIIHQPKAAGEESPLAGRQAVAGIVGFVPQNEFIIDEQPLLDRSQRSLNPRVVRRKEADKRNQEQTRVEPVDAVGLHEAIEIAIESTLADFGMNFVRDRPPLLPGLVEGFYANFIRCAIEGDPGHHLGMDEVLASAAHLPNPFIRLPPGFREILQNQRAYGPTALGRAMPNSEKMRSRKSGWRWFFRDRVRDWHRERK